MRKQQIAIITLALWLTFVSVFMLIFQWIDLELIFVLWFIGVLVILQFMEQKYFQADYVEYINYLIIISSLIFGAILVQKVLEILSP